jgi:hypothetical protein
MNKNIIIVMFVSSLLLLALIVPSMAADMNGKAGQMPAYYDGELFTLNMMEMPNSDPLILHNRSINLIFVSKDLDEEQSSFL